MYILLMIHLAISTLETLKVEAPNFVDDPNSNHFFFGPIVNLHDSIWTFIILKTQNAAHLVAKESWLLFIIYESHNAKIS